MFPPLCGQVYRVYGERNTSSFLPTTNCILSLLVLPGVLVLGLVLCLITLALFCRLNHLQQHQNKFFPSAPSIVPYFMALSTFDSIQLVLSLPIFLIDSYQTFFFAVHGSEEWIPMFLQSLLAYTVKVFYPVMMTANYASTWTVVLICVQRFFAVCYPLWMRKVFWLWHCRKAVVAMTVVCSLFNVVRYWEYNLSVVDIDNVTSVVVLLPNPAVRNDRYELFYEGLLYLFLIYAIPFVCLTVLGSRILCVLKESRHLSVRKSRRQVHEYQSSLLILTIMGVFFGCHTLSPILRIWRILDPVMSLEFYATGRGLMETLNNLLINVNSAANPLICFIFTRRRRDIFGKISHHKSSNPTSVGRILMDSTHRSGTGSTSPFILDTKTIRRQRLSQPLLSAGNYRSPSVSEIRKVSELEDESFV